MNDDDDGVNGDDAEEEEEPSIEFVDPRRQDKVS